MYARCVVEYNFLVELHSVQNTSLQIVAVVVNMFPHFVRV